MLPIACIACTLVLCWILPTSALEVPSPFGKSSLGTHSRRLSRRTEDISDGEQPVPTNFRPVIGVLSQPKGPGTYIAASYMKYVEMAGARVIPIFSDSTEEEHRHMFSKINGLLVPGGDQDLRPGNSYYDSQSLFTDLAKEAFAQGDVFPIHFTCLGFEALSIKFSGNYSLLGDFPAMGTVDPLKWTPAADTARMLRFVSPELKQAAAERGLAYMSHHYGVALSDFYNTALQDAFNLLSTSVDQEGKEYLSTMEHKTLPIFGVQWHPEKAPFEWSRDILDSDHSVEAIQLSHAFANQFVEWARMSNHSFSSPEDLEELNRRLIYNYRPMFDPKAYFTEVYVFTDGGTGGFSPMEAAAFACVLTLVLVAVAVLAGRQIAGKMKMARSEFSESGSFEAETTDKSPRRHFTRMSSELQPLSGLALSSAHVV